MKELKRRQEAAEEAERQRLAEEQAAQEEAAAAARQQEEERRRRAHPVQDTTDAPQDAQGIFNFLTLMEVVSLFPAVRSDVDSFNVLSKHKYLCFLSQ